MYLSTWR